MPSQGLAPGGAVKQKCTPTRTPQLDDRGSEPIPWLRNMRTARDEHDDFARGERQHDIDQAARDPAKTAMGVDECGASVDADSHDPHDLTNALRWSVVVPTRVGWPNLHRSLVPLLAALAEFDEIIIASDGLPLDLPAHPDVRCKVVVNNGPRGFATTCNLGAHSASGRWLFFLNDDVEVGLAVLDELEAAMRDLEIAAAGPNVWSERLGRSESGTVLEWHHGVLETRQDSLSADGAREVPYLCGAALAVRRSDFLRAGGFDERLAPYYWEDVDLSLRLCSDRRRLVVLTDEIVLHRHGVTIAADDPHLRGVIYERNRLLVSWQHARGLRWIQHLLWMPVRVLASTARDRSVLQGLLAALRLVQRSRK